MREAFAAVKEALMSGNINQVASDFGCCQIPKDPYDQVMTCFDGHQALVHAVLFIFCFLKKLNIYFFVITFFSHCMLVISCLNLCNHVKKKAQLYFKPVYSLSVINIGQLSGILLHFIAKFNLMVKCQSCSCETFTAKHNMVLVQYRVLLSC